MTTTATEATAPDPMGQIVARGGTYYRVTRFLFAAVMLAMGAWFGYDGYVTYPRSNQLHLLHAREPAQYPKDYPTYDAKSIGIQKVLAVVLPAGALALLAWTLHHSRGAYRLAGDVLSVPGHPDVPLDHVTQIDKSRWDRKGIARLEYALPTGEKGTVTLDDFVYDRPPTDRILETIEARLGVGGPGKSSPESNPVV